MIGLGHKGNRWGVVLITIFFISYLCYVNVNVYHIYPTPPLGQDMTQGQFLSGV